MQSQGTDEGDKCPQTIKSLCTRKAQLCKVFTSGDLASLWLFLDVFSQMLLVFSDGSKGVSQDGINPWDHRAPTHS